MLSNNLFDNLPFNGGKTTVSKTKTKPDHQSPPGMPRWVKVLGIVALVLILLLVILMLVADPDGGHGPSRHLPSGGAGDIPSDPIEIILVGGIQTVLSSKYIPLLSLLG